MDRRGIRYTKNRSGPRMEPCGTPTVTLVATERLPLIITVCLIPIPRMHCSTSSCKFSFQFTPGWTSSRVAVPSQDSVLNTLLHPAPRLHLPSLITSISISRTSAWESLMTTTQQMALGRRSGRLLAGWLPGLSSPKENRQQQQYRLLNLH